MTDVALVIVGLVALIGGAWLMVREASRLALGIGLSPVLVGGTIVAFGTSAPELIVGTFASAHGSGELTVGSVLGSNVADVGLVLGIAMVIRPLTLGTRLLRWELLVLGVATALMLLFGASGEIGRLEGATLFALLIVFIAGSVAIGSEAAQALGVTVEDEPPPAKRLSPWTQLAPLIVAVIALAGGAELLVRGATGLAERLAISEVVIGAVIVAVGTSLPEVATSTVAAWRRQPAIAVGNAVGSNVFNLLGVLGLAALVSPLPVQRDLYQLEMPALAMSTVILLALERRKRLERSQGLLLLFLYGSFLAAVLNRG